MKIKTHLRTLYAIIAMSLIVQAGTCYKYNQDTLEYLGMINSNLRVVYTKVDTVHQDVKSIGFWVTLNK